MKTILLDLASKSLSPDELDIRMQELESLMMTYGGAVIVKKVQRRDEIDYRTYVGPWKLKEIAEEARTLGVDTLVIGNILKPGQIYAINELFRAEKIPLVAWDRVDLILKIFAQHASTPESRIQIHLAALKHMGPRIYGMSMELGNQGRGGGQSKGKGETNTEIMKRHLRDEAQQLKKELKVYERTRSEQRKNRRRKGLRIAGIVGYTNAGKSSLMNRLTHKGVLAEDKLFATLGTSVGKVWLATEDGRWEEFLVSDTIGFIRDLPPDLIEAFRSTLEDSVESDVLLHVIDGSDRNWREKIDIVNATLGSIGAQQKRLVVFNKVDQMSPQQREEIEGFTQGEEIHTLPHYAGACFVSAHTGTGIEELKQLINAELSIAD